MRPGTKLALVAVLSAAVTAFVLLTAGAVFDDPVSLPPDTVDAPPAGPGEALRSEEPPERRPVLSDLRPSRDELDFLREALVAERRRRRAARVRPGDTGIEILSRAFDERSDVTDLLSDFDTFAAHVRPAEGPVASLMAAGDVTKVSLDDLPPETAVVEFGPGRFLVRSRRFSHLREDVASLEIRGAGMDRTTLVASDTLLLLKRLEHLRIRDLTFDGGDRGDQILDVRGKCAAVLENVRMVGWMSAGYSAPIGTMGEVYLGLDGCEFIGKRSGRGGATALAVRGHSLVSARRCLFADLNPVIYGSAGAAGKSEAVFTDCTFENAALAHRGFLHQERPEFPLRVRGGVVRLGHSSWPEELRPKKWGAAYAAEAPGVRFAPGAPRAPLSAVLHAIELAPVRADEVLLGLSVRRAARGVPLRLELHWYRPEEKRDRMRSGVYDYTGGTLVEVPDAHVYTASDPGEAARPDVGWLLRACPIPRDAEIRSVRYAEHWDGSGRVPAFQVESDWTGGWVLGARDGGILYEYPLR